MQIALSCKLYNRGEGPMCHKYPPGAFLWPGVINRAGSDWKCNDMGRIFTSGSNETCWYLRNVPATIRRRHLPRTGMETIFTCVFLRDSSTQPMGFSVGVVASWVCLV